MSAIPKRLLGLIGFLVAGLLVVAPAAAYDNKACLACHNLGSTASRLTMDGEQFNASIHGENLGCQDCHLMVEDEGHTETPGSGAVDCSQCHEQENYHGLNGERPNRPNCADCHTRHNIRPADDPAAAVYAANLTTTCGQCHRVQCGDTDYFSRLPSIKINTHPKGDLNGDYGEENCIGCHQGQAAHGEADPISAATCYKCHMTPEGDKALLGFIHPRADVGDQPGVFVVGLVYQLVLLSLVLGGAIFFVRKLSRTNRNHRNHRNH